MNLGRVSPRLPALLPVLWAAVLPLLLLGPALGIGYVLSFDMVWVPDLALRSDFLGLGTALPRAVPSDAVIAVLDEVVPGMVLQKLVLYGALLIAGLGCARLVGDSTLARLVAVSLAIWNPFVVERLWIGHWPVLLGYATVPWLVLAGRRIRREGSIPPSVWLLLPLGSLSASAALVSALTLAVSASGRLGPEVDHSRARLVHLRLAVGCAAVNAPWVVAGLLHADDALSAGGFDVFALSREGSLPAPLAALGLGGIWNSDVVPSSREGGLAWVGLVIVLVLAVVGARSWWQRAGDPRLIWLWGVGYLLALVTWASPETASWVGAHVPGGGLLRDGTRSLALCIPLLVCLTASGADLVHRRARAGAPRAAMALACVLLPVATMTDAAWGIGGNLRASQFPDSYSAARAAVGDPAEDLLVLPFSSYRAPTWNGGRKVLDPLGRYLRPNYVVNDELSISGVVVPGEDPRVPRVHAALAQDTPASRAAALGQLGIRFVARELDAPGVADPAYDAAVAGTPVYAGADLAVVEITADVHPREVTMATRWWMSVAWAGFIGGLAWGLVKVGKRAVQRWLLARKQVLESPAES
ncbi:hypothetical protein [Nocardioides sp.]|uniref:hypothetical protein n=1 Tax=Nocardioides sp. TaxID=35761 RepID=UPI003D111705